MIFTIIYLMHSAKIFFNVLHDFLKILTLGTVAVARYVHWSIQEAQEQEKMHSDVERKLLKVLMSPVCATIMAEFPANLMPESILILVHEGFSK